VTRRPDADVPGAVSRRRLPWGLEIEYITDAAIGQSLSLGGIFDACVSETIFRLLDAGETAVDVGANIGYMTCLMARRAGARGRVLAYEPHPRVFELLARNAERWNAEPELAEIVVRESALADAAGTADLFAPGGFDRNVGAASLSVSEKWGDDPTRIPEVRLATVDDELANEDIALMKIDVEGHEHDVVRGGSRLFERGGVRDLVFEHKHSYPSRLSRELEAWGYELFSLDNSLFGPAADPAAERPPRSSWEGPSYLATRSPERALRRLDPRGWAVLGQHRVRAALDSS
jgi:FkbM family methyltransferase